MFSETACEEEHCDPKVYTEEEYNAILHECDDLKMKCNELDEKCCKYETECSAHMSKVEDGYNKSNTHWESCRTCLYSSAGGLYCMKYSRTISSYDKDKSKCSQYVWDEDKY